MHDYNLFTDIKKLLIESHTKEEIKTLSTSELKKLHKEYSEKDTDEAKSEAEMIKKEIESRGEEKVEENFNTHRPLGSSISGRYADGVFAAHDARQKGLKKAAEERAARLAAEKEAKAKAEKKPVAEQNEELLAILDTLCEMVGLDMMTLVEETRKQMRDLGHASGWDKPAPAGAPHGKLAANARDVIVQAVMARGTRNERIAAAARADAIPAGVDTAYKIETDTTIKDIHEPTAERRARGEPGAVVDPRRFDKTQGSIESISDKVGEVARATAKREETTKRLLPFALQPKPKGKGKGKK
jgi:hypothetical protein